MESTKWEFGIPDGTYTFTSSNTVQESPAASSEEIAELLRIWDLEGD